VDVSTQEPKTPAQTELEAALREPDGIAPARELWIHENLEDEVRRLWEKR
jgi:hypothetical protein